jgi:branched-chain amino acid transport system ATP-binding protein
MSSLRLLGDREMSLLTLRGVQSGYGAMQILWGVDLDVGEGETVLLLGANSAGKTTLLRTIIGLLPCWQGSIEFAGERLEHLAPDKRIQRGIAFMSELGVFPTLSIEENIRLGGYFLSDGEVRKRSVRLFDLFPDLAKKRREPAASLSGGQRKMLGIAKVLVSEPKLLLMDEPSSAGLRQAGDRGAEDDDRRRRVAPDRRAECRLPGPGQSRFPDRPRPGQTVWDAR